MFNSICFLLKKMADNELNSNICKEAKGTYKKTKSFKFVFILHLMKKVLGIFDMLCQTLQMESQYILNALNLVSTTKILIRKL